MADRDTGPGIEMSADPRFAGRICRLTATSAIALGLVWLLWARGLDTHPAIGFSLAGGWLLMPLTLGLSLRWSWLRLGLVIPSTLISVALIMICLTALPANPLARVGWLSLTAGILLGAILGLWFWFRWFPVPWRLDDPFAPARWWLIGLHVGLVVAGVIVIGLFGTS